MTRSIRTLLSFVVAVAAMSSWLVAAGPTPIADAAKKGDRETVRTLLKQGGDVWREFASTMNTLLREPA